MSTKSKKVNGVQLSSRCFAYVGDEQDTNTWHVCIHVLGDAKKTINAVKNALARFEATKGIPASERDAVWHTVRGAALALGIVVHERAKSAEPVVVAEPPRAVKEKPLKRDKHTEAIFAEADRRASAFLKSLAGC